MAEYARAYIDRLGRPYVEQDILAIAREQLRQEEEMEQQLGNGKTSPAYLFCDTEALVTEIWSEVKYGRCDPWILHQVERRVYDLYLLCDIDIPWEYDPQREHPLMREHLFNLYHSALQERGRNFRVVSGLGIERLQNAIKFIDESLFERSGQ